ncbi:hypothetical protein BQ8482_110715 [Mesorhizobium delmotii]|uniref:Uncharacterized protein n=1 Tax=Mesorhizobium delmotii TaxID=1631247 RepID=A0A2P9ACD0_9HYPH|nr:hypothetical protein BQ8482_110715 [Mesorhizobium delmotii]
MLWRRDRSRVSNRRRIRTDSFAGLAALWFIGRLRRWSRGLLRHPAPARGACDVEDHILDAGGDIIARSTELMSIEVSVTSIRP